jgi:hypothetical protein
MGPEGFEPPPDRLKVCCAAVTPRPRMRTWRRLFKSSCSIMLSVCAIARDGVEPSLPPYQNDVLPLHHQAKSGWSDSNRRSRGPRPRGVPLPYILLNCCIDPCGIRTQPRLLEGQVTSPEVERALSVYARSPSSGTARNDCGMWAGRRSNPSLLVFSQALHRLSYQPRQKRKPGVLCVTPGF